MLELFLLTTAFAADLSDAETDPRAVMQVVESRDVGDKMTAQLAIDVTDAAGRSRSRELSLAAMAIDGGRAQLFRFTAPEDVAGAAVLAVDHREGPDEQWLYLPSVGAPTALLAGAASGSFMGTDLTYADMTTRDPALYSYTMLDGATALNGEAAWLIETRATSPDERAATGVLKTHVWVSKSKHIPLQTKSWVIEGKRTRYTRFLDPIKHHGAWWPRTIEVKTVKDGALVSTSTVTFSKVRFDQDSLSAEQFRPEALAAK